jgi:predicted kinase
VNERGGSVLIVSGPAASGKTTVAQLVASTFERSVHVEADRFFGFVVGGYVDPWDREAHEQNTVVMEIACDAARRYAEAGYLTVLDGMFIPGWFYEPVRDRLSAASLDVSAVIIRPPRATALERGRARVPPKLLDDAVLEHLWRAFEDLGPLEDHVIENDTDAPAATAEAVVRRLADGALRV